MNCNKIEYLTIFSCHVNNKPSIKRNTAKILHYHFNISFSRWRYIENGVAIYFLPGSCNWKRFGHIEITKMQIKLNFIQYLQHVNQYQWSFVDCSLFGKHTH